MREILFKAQRADGSGWIEGDLITKAFIRHDTKEPIIYIFNNENDIDCFENIREDMDIFEVLPETICQFTGVLDKNGVKIFEGDILSDIYEVDGEMKESALKVFFSLEHGQWMLDYSADQDETAFYSLYKELEDYEYRVIGNIHDKYETK